MEQAIRHEEGAAGLRTAQRRRVEAVVETLANLRSPGESLAALAHDARNMLTALGLYCDLLEEPGVLATPFAHYGSELRLVAASSRGLVEKLLALDAGAGSPLAGERAPGSRPRPAELDTAPAAGRLGGAGRWDAAVTLPIPNLAAELLANCNVLAALAGPAIALTVEAEGGARGVRLTAEDLTRILVNLVKNAAEAMPSGGRIHITLREQPEAAGTVECLLLVVEDSGPGIAENALEKVFESGYTTRARERAGSGGWPATHRGLGLAITRSIVEAAGGRIFSARRTRPGARFEIELPGNGKRETGNGKQEIGNRE